jgi:hypothetical protein
MPTKGTLVSSIHQFQDVHTSSVFNLMDSNLVERKFPRSEFFDHPLYNHKKTKQSPASVWYGSSTSKKVKVWCKECLRAEIALVQQHERNNRRADEQRDFSEIKLSCE